MKNALVSVYNKEELEDFIRFLISKGYKIYCTSGTYKYLIEKGLNVESIEDLTGFKPTEDGRVKTLQPLIFKGILGRGDENYDIYFDIVVVNLYPFEKEYFNFSSIEEMVELIDIGGVSLLRAAAKNWERVTVINEISDYVLVKELLEQHNRVPIQVRKKLSTKVFSYTSYYDSLISFKFFIDEDCIDYLSIAGKIEKELKYGENPSQIARFYSSPVFNSRIEVINKKMLSYNNILDLDTGISLIENFQKPVVAILKHTTPCGVARSKNTIEAYKEALDADSLSAYGGVLVTNRTIDHDLALLIKKHFYELIAAPEITDSAIDLLKKKKRLRIVKFNDTTNNGLSIKTTKFGILYQKENEVKQEWRIVTKRKPDAEEMEAMKFAWKVVKWVKSNAIVVSSSNKTLGISGGQTARIFAAMEALERSKKFKSKVKVIASD